MLIPSIDLQRGRVVQLVQGERLALESNDLDGWLERFARFPLVQVVDLDAAMRAGDNRALVREICGRRRCQVGGGIRTPDDAASLVEAGAARVIVGSALFGAAGPRPDRARAFAEAIGPAALMAAVDARGGLVVIDGWKTSTGVPVDDAIEALEPWVGGFLATLVDGEGLMRGVDRAAAARLRARTTKPIVIAGGVTTAGDVRALEALGLDAVVGMAIYTGALDLAAFAP
jgi:phosphoribosylformimino-5-aminoimidazole carboxamide ribotide isomerase